MADKSNTKKAFTVVRHNPLFKIRTQAAKHVGAKNQNFCYQLMGSELSVTDQERDLGVLVDSSMKVSRRPIPF